MGGRRGGEEKEETRQSRREMHSGTTDDEGDRVKCQKSKVLEKSKKNGIQFMYGGIGLCHQEVLCFVVMGRKMTKLAYIV